MASFFNQLRFGRQGNRSPQPPAQPSPTSPSPNSLTTPTPKQVPHSPPGSAGDHRDRSVNADNMQTSPLPTRQPFYFRPENANLIVKGNFMTIAAKPQHVDLGEWLAHQVVEQYRLLESMIKIVSEPDRNNGNLGLCNNQACPQMVAPGGTVYTWLDNHKNPVRIPAAQYIGLVQKWIMQKITDHRIFPIDTTFSNQPNSATYPSSSSGASGTSTPTQSHQPIGAGPTNLQTSLSKLSGQDRDWVGRANGFPESFMHDIRQLYRQMFRIYAHLYERHWIEPFYHLSMYKDLNTCFLHFMNVGRQYDLLVDKETTPMAPLIKIWIARGDLPEVAADRPPQSASQAQTPVDERASQQSEISAMAA